MLKIKFLKPLLFMFFLATTLQVSAQDISEELGDFSELKTFHGIEVTFVPSKESRIVISGHSKDKVKYEIIDGSLEVKLALDNLWSEDNTRITVYGTVEAIDANQGSNVAVKGRLEAPKLTLRTQEGSNIYAEVRADELYVKAVSGGIIELSGISETQEVEVNTAGNYEGGDVRTKRTVISAGTAGKAVVYASEYCKATAKLGAVIKVLGNPDDLDTKTSLGGKIL